VTYAETVHRGPTARLFVAVDPPEDARNALADWARSAMRAADARARGGTPPRLLDPESLHVTLCFLGNRPAAEIDEIAARLGACGGPAGELSIGAPLWLPARNPRALAVELHDEDGRLARLQADVTAAIEETGERLPNSGASGSEESRRRRFHPHITIARSG
jgi:RNA 2',3'-cyclic 3'-phosphodiesterase